MMEIRIENMASRTWDAIGYDCLVNDMGEPDESVTMSRDEVMEIVADAGHMKMYGNDKEAWEAWQKLPSYEKKLEAISGAFLYEIYGW